MHARLPRTTMRRLSDNKLGEHTAIILPRGTSRLLREFRPVFASQRGTRSAQSFATWSVVRGRTLGLTVFI